MTNNQKQWVAWGISTIVVLALSLTLGVKYPLPAPPDDLPDPVISLGITHFSGLTVDGDVTNIGGGTPAVAAGDNDLYVTADLEVDGEIEADGAIDADSTLNVQGAPSLSRALSTRALPISPLPVVLPTSRLPTRSTPWTLPALSQPPYRPPAPRASS